MKYHFNKSDYMDRSTYRDMVHPFLMDVSRSAATRQKYMQALNQFCDYFKKDFLLIDEDDVASYADDMTSAVRSGMLGEGTVAVRLSAASSFGDYVCGLNADYENPFASCHRFKTSDQVHITHLPTVEEVDCILSSAKHDPMLFLIITLSFRCVLSTSQILSITDKGIRQEKGSVYIDLPPKTQFDALHVVKLPQDVATLLLSYLSTVDRRDEEGHIFLSPKLKKPTVMSERSLQYAVRKVINAAELHIKDYSLQSIRNKGIVLLLQSGAQIGDVGEYAYVGERALQRFKGVALATSHESIPPDLVNIKIVMPNV